MLTLFRDLNAKVIDLETLESAIKIVLYYIDERIRILHASQMDPDLVLAQKLLRWLLNDWIKREPNGLVSLPDIYQSGPNPIRNQKTALRIVEILEEHGWLAPEGRVKVGGRWRREAWRLWRKN